MKKQRTWDLIGMIAGAVILVLGIVVLAVKAPEYSFNWADSASFGADYYTYQYEATEYAANNAASIGRTLRGMAVAMNRGLGFLVLSIGLLAVIHYGKAFFTAAAPEKPTAAQAAKTEPSAEAQAPAANEPAAAPEQGEMLFTHFGISGPLTLSASSHLGDMKKHKYEAFIDLKPALSEEQLYDRITQDFALLANHAAQGALVKLLPSSMQPVMVARWGIDPATRANQITREQKRELVQLCKHWKVPIDARGDLAHAVITSGGVSVREVDPKTMQSKKALGLYFAGEVLDVDAYTGGYNLQIAFCTAQSFANNL